MPALKNQRWEEFAQRIATGAKATAAYRDIFKTSRSKTAEVEGCKLKKSPKVAQRIKEIALRYAQRIEQKAAAVIEEKFLTLDRKRELLREFAVDVTAQIPHRIKALELDAKLAHELTDKIEVKDVTLKEPLADIRERLIQANRLRAQPTHGVS